MSGAVQIPVAVLFDLDGTLVDSAADLTAAINALRQELGLAPVPVAQVRSAISVGARAILARGLAELEADERERHLDAFLLRYRDCIGSHGGLFPDIAEVLATIEASGACWGVVSNKREDLARIVLERLALLPRCAVLIGGDTLARSKPDPLPVLSACERLGARPAQAVFIGDDARDIQAGRAAGTRTIAVRWGFHAEHDDPAAWGADQVLDRPAQLLLPGVLSGT